MKSRVFSVLFGIVLAAAALGAQAQQLAYAAKTVNVRAGPDRAYPVVLVLAPNTQVIVQGCIADYRWCDVAIGVERGWVYAGNLLTPWGERLLPLPPMAPYVGIVIAPFVIHDYWSLHYRNRPWYPEWHRWARPAPHFAPMPQPHYAQPHYPPPQVRPHGVYPAPGVRPPYPGVHPAPQVHPAPGHAQPHPAHPSGPRRAASARRRSAARGSSALSLRGSAARCGE